MKAVSQLAVKIYGDGADLAGILELSRLPYIKGFTTNPTLMRKAGVPDYEEFAAEVLRNIKDRPVSFEVFADDEETMEAQAKHIAGWAKNVYVKIPVTNMKREPMYGLIRRLSHEGIQVNVTAMMTLEQMREAVEILRGNPRTELIWASPRELLNIFQADEIGCHIITVTNDILAKLKLVGKDLEDFSLETVKMFHNDAAKAGYTLGVAETARRAKGRD